MKQTLIRSQIYYEIAMSIGNSHDLKAVLQESLSAYLNKLNCSAVLVLMTKEGSDGNIVFAPISSIPRNADANPTIQVAMKRIPDGVPLVKASSFLNDLPIKGKDGEEGSYHVMELPDFGLLILAKRGNAFDFSVIESLKPLNEKLAKSCIACLHKEKTEKINDEPFEDGMVPQRQFQEVLPKENDENRILVEQLPVPVSITAQDSRHIYVNRAFTEIFGYSLEDISTGREWFTKIHPDEKYHKQVISTWVNDLRELSRGDPRSQAFTVTCKNGSEKTIHLRHITMGTGEQFVIYEEIADRKRDLDTLQYQAEFERLISSISTHLINLEIDEVDDGIKSALQEMGEFANVDHSYVFLLREEGTKIDLSHEWCAEGIKSQIEKLKGVSIEVFTWSMERLNRFENIDVTRVADLPPEASVEKEMLERQNIHSLILVPMTYGGSLVGFVGLASERMQKSWSQKIVTLMKIMGEIFASTLARKSGFELLQKSHDEQEARARERTAELREANKFLNKIMESLSYPFYVIDANDYTIRIANSAACVKSSSGKAKCYAITHKRSGPCGGAEHCCPLEEVKKWKKPITVEHVHYDSDGNTRYVEVHADPIFDSKGNVIQMIEYTLDITDKKHAEENLKKAKEGAEAANRAKSQFLASMSHELRTPLNAILGFSELLQDPYFGDLNEKQAEFIKNIWEAGKHLLSLIDDILDLSKIEVGKTQFELSKVNVKELLEQSLIMIKEKCAKHVINLSLSIANGLEDLDITSDERRLKQIMFNLLSNAVKFTPDSGEIAVEAKQKGEELLISVSDTGVGIAPAELEKIFEEFYQVSADLTNKTPGTGLGLPLTKRLVDMAGGRIWAESEGKGRGSRFSFTLPIGPAQAKSSILRITGENTFLNHLESVFSLSKRHDRFFTLCRLCVDTQRQSESKGAVMEALEKEKRVEDLSGIDEDGYIYLILQETGREKAHAVCDRFKKKVEHVIEGSKVFYSIATFPQDGTTPKDLLKKLIISENTMKTREKACMGQVILVVEDEPRNLKLIRELLQRAGYKTLEASNGKEGIELAQTHKPDLILMDILTPVMNGIEATKILKADAETENIPIIALTSFAMKGDKEKIIQAGCDGHITKPINTRQILGRINELLSG